MREIVVGDIHGQAANLSALVRKVEHHYQDEDVLYVFVGDLVDRGPESREVIASVRNLSEEGRGACVLGNHDELFVQAIALLRPDLLAAAGIDTARFEPLVADYRYAPQLLLRHWISQGGAETVRSYGGKAWQPETWDIPLEDVTFLVNRPLAWQGRSFVVSHARAGEAALQAALAAGNAPWTLAEQFRHQLLWNRSAPADPPQQFHVCGHTPRQHPVPHPADAQSAGSIEIDTGCVFGNSLTAYDPAEDRILQVPCDNPR